MYTGKKLYDNYRDEFNAIKGKNYLTILLIIEIINLNKLFFIQ